MAAQVANVWSYCLAGAVPAATIWTASVLTFFRRYVYVLVALLAVLAVAAALTDSADTAILLVVLAFVPVTMFSVIRWRLGRSAR